MQRPRGRWGLDAILLRRERRLPKRDGGVA